MRLVLALVLLVAVGACSSAKDSSGAAPTRAPTSSPSARPSGPGSGPDVSESRACAQVRAGIDAFNALDFEGTVAHFKLALPLARAQARAHSSQAAEDLVEAVAYYAGLAPKDYPLSARTSRDFAKYKAITLGQCVSPAAPLQDDPSGSPGVTT
jgi:hypothetical protein